MSKYAEPDAKRRRIDKEQELKNTLARRIKESLDTNPQEGEAAAAAAPDLCAAVSEALEAMFPHINTVVEQSNIPGTVFVTHTFQNGASIALVINGEPTYTGLYSLTELNGIDAQPDTPDPQPPEEEEIQYIVLDSEGDSDTDPESKEIDYPSDPDSDSDSDKENHPQTPNSEYDLEDPQEDSEHENSSGSSNEEGASGHENSSGYLHSEMLLNTIAKLLKLYPGLRFTHTDCGDGYTLFYTDTDEGIISFFTHGDQIIASEGFAGEIFPPEPLSVTTGYSEQNETHAYGPSTDVHHLACACVGESLEQAS